ncbi:hypothetical protein MMC25_002870 [Agyrium rufum]|nr:hypothetical protein [Agyrium rufum]
MNDDRDTDWSPMVPGADDFANFLEFPELHLGFPSFAGSAQDGEPGQVESMKSGELEAPLESDMAVDTYQAMTTHAGIEQGMIQREMDSRNCNPMQNEADHILNLDLSTHVYTPHSQQSKLQSRQIRDQYQHRGLVPPTPDSLEMNGACSEYYQHIGTPSQALYHHYARKQQEQLSFTPLVSPAVTPLDNNFRVPEFPLLGEYFSPLTSPALEAQHQHSHGNHPLVRGSDTSDTISPPSGYTEMVSPVEQASDSPYRKPTVKRTPVSGRGNGRNLRHAPVVKVLGRRKAASTIPAAKSQRNIASDMSKSKDQTTTGSQMGSTPLEPLDDALMPPPSTTWPPMAGPPTSGATGNSDQGATTQAHRNHAATPSSLMRITKTSEPTQSRELLELKARNRSAETVMEQIMEEMPLPDGEDLGRPTAPQSTDNADVEDKPAHPSTNVMAGSQIRRKGSPSVFSANLGSKSALSPTSEAIPSVGALPHKQAILATNTKKRNSSSHESPAIRPRISPSIQPLLPQGTPPFSSTTTTALLAAKSNYQNILDGTQVPGLNYPSTLATNLTSKRTSHKIAEQGRRNRINTALVEIASLLPSGWGGHNDSGDTNPAGHNAGNSKARTVEAAIEYIRALQGEVKDLKGKVAALELNQTQRAQDEKPTNVCDMK